MHSGQNAQEAICRYFKRLNALQDQIDELNTEKSEVLKEAKSIGLDSKTLSKVVQRSRKDRAAVEEADEMLEIYEAAVLAASTNPKLRVVA